MSTPKRPVNRVTSKRRPTPDSPAKPAADTSAADETPSAASEDALTPAPSEAAVSESAASEVASTKPAAGGAAASEVAGTEPAAGEAAASEPATASEAAATSKSAAVSKAAATSTFAATGKAGATGKASAAGKAAAASKVGLDKAEATNRAASAGADAAGGEPASAAPAGERKPTTALRGWGVPIACLLAAAVLAGFAVVAALRPGVPDNDKAFVDSGATEEVRAAADNALKTIYGYDVTAIDGYPDAVRQVVTGDMLKDLDQFAPTTIEAIKQSQTSATAAADPIGVTLLTDDRAELLVNLVVSATKDGAAQQSVAGPVVLRMTKVDGRWLAAEIVDR
ncbi:hypothetical protein [Nocardia asteroides]|uniref:hypothetical protein n=1 Tax=Nocardia asteroides TaxID=1824 RepID=UPI001E645167|nr:hypothetical protein [Nocardia asteroides]UGT64600.1 hypothetical protein LTT61_15485 [Nocardia asteroides]